MAKDGTALSRWMKKRPEQQSGIAPLPNNGGGFVEYACMSHDHGTVPHYYRRRTGTGSTCECGRNN